MAKTRHVLVAGRVQGVGFRHWTRQRAAALGLAGWVRNRRDGVVEAVFTGDVPALDAMLSELRSGPVGASVTSVEVREGLEPSTGPFEVRPTA